MVTSDLSEIPSSTIQTKLTKIVENQLQSSNYNINVSSASQSGANNFLGIVYRVGFSRENENDKNKTSNLILKVAPTNEARRAQFFARPSFLRENFIYNEVIVCFKIHERTLIQIEMLVIKLFCFVRCCRTSVNLSYQKE